ncbi:MAG TPA: hypothetical protein PLP07_15105 [Pyrinomonadaceae bacterium]|nr:hypothetical protein [Chloracidobacterium sp.]MBP9936525.1 hypothetical protein [Pyrinomonadaceae bacterium]MBK7802744.1 hypothetical protein [Chloracidobacterium sp.]MBK9437599.1 hypothetical protein [Chloracidobacterium sp.]MBK9767171.1 hypothetical protein [Chloracidobacterium sp.]
MSFFNRRKQQNKSTNVWARQGMLVTFRAEIMPGKLREERTFRIESVMPNGRVILENFLGEHREGAFEAINFLRDKANEPQN